jgi:hypothetical protein
MTGRGLRRTHHVGKTGVVGVIHPTLETGVEALMVGAHAWLSWKAP